MNKLAVMGVLLAACGSDAGGGKPVTTSEAMTLCEAFATHATSCGWGGNVNGYDWNCGEAALVWRAEAFQAFAECATALPCTGDGASCYQQTREATAPLGYHDDYAAACMARVTECDLGIAMCSADAFKLYTGDIVAALTSCFERPCGEIQTCIASVL